MDQVLEELQCAYELVKHPGESEIIQCAIAAGDSGEHPAAYVVSPRPTRNLHLLCHICQNMAELYGGQFPLSTGFAATMLTAASGIKTPRQTASSVRTLLTLKGVITKAKAGDFKGHIANEYQWTWTDEETP